jgi:mRNA-degrading endonuclease RelE of RelBE toxin-antitoxin system
LEFEIAYAPAAGGFLQQIRGPSAAYLKQKIETLTSEPEKQGNPGTGELARYWELISAGQYQVLYTINRKLKKVTIVSISLIFP